MKRWILIIILFLGYSVSANKQQTDVLLKKAEKLMLMNPKEAFQIAEKAYKDNSLNHKEKLNSLFILTNTSNLLQNPLNVIKYGNEALKIADNGDDVITKIKILGILGNTYQFLKLNEKTRIYLDQAELLLSSPKITDSLSLVKGNIFYLKAMNYFYGLDSDIALSYFNKAINQYVNSKNPLAEINIKLAYLNKGYCLIQQKKLNEALENLKLASVNPKESSRPYPPQFAELQEAFVELGKAKILSGEGKPELSNEMLFKILETRKNQPARDDIENDIYELLSENYLQLKDIKQHDYYEGLFMKQVTQSNQEAASWVNKLIAQEKVQNNIEKESISQKYLLMTTISSIVFGAIIIFLLFKTIKIQQKKNMLKKKVSENI
ncbi:MAG: hypothetical protein DI529_00755 [Chryseobacterium sp.]|nr:MAG: hypothetical protein DI529_00755 [Chryseobacterium sp.]